jgi:hypothetical protein
MHSLGYEFDDGSDEDWFEARNSCFGEECSVKAVDCFLWESRDPREAEGAPIPWRERQHVKSEANRTRHRGMHPKKLARKRRDAHLTGAPPVAGANAPVDAAGVNTTVTRTTKTRTSTTRTTITTTTTTTQWHNRFDAKRKKRSKGGKAIFWEDFEDGDAVNRWQGQGASSLIPGVTLITDKKACKKGHSCLRFSACGDEDVTGSVFSKEEFICSVDAPCDVSFW